MSKFRNFVNKKIQCTGIHCIDNQFKCRQGGNKDCYHVEHIIDENQGDLITCKNGCKNIAANLVMAWGRWNSALGGLGHVNYKESLSEKIRVYGKRRVENVIEQILLCDRFNNELKRDKIELQVVNTNSTYDKDCDSVEDCDCNTDADCGCDCDFEIDNNKRTINMWWP